MEITNEQANDVDPNKEYFRFEANYNCEELVRQREKAGKRGWIFTCFGAIFIIPAILIGISDNPTAIWGVVLFLAFAASFMGIGLYMAKYNKKNPKNDAKTMIFTFLELTIDFRINNNAKSKVKNLSRCFYRPYKDYQYVKSVTKTNDIITFRIFTGTYNAVPQYAKYDIPKSCIGSAAAELEDFLKERLGNDYKIKERI
jgi:hypothetical protein